MLSVEWLTANRSSKELSSLTKFVSTTFKRSFRFSLFYRRSPFNSCVLFKSHIGLILCHQISCNVTQMTQEIKNVKMSNFHSALKPLCIQHLQLYLRFLTRAFYTSVFTRRFHYPSFPVLVVYTLFPLHAHSVFPRNSMRASAVRAVFCLPLPVLHFAADPRTLLRLCINFTELNFQFFVNTCGNICSERNN